MNKLDRFMRTTGAFAWRPGAPTVVKCADCGQGTVGAFGDHVCHLQNGNVMIVDLKHWKSENAEGPSDGHGYGDEFPEPDPPEVEA